MRADFTGQRFGRLVGIRMTRRLPNRVALWLFRCDCGTEKEMQPASVRYGGTLSCGCYFREVRGAKREHFRDKDGVFCVALDQGMFARIDDEAIGAITARTWYSHRRPNAKPYAVSQRRMLLMHRFLLGAKPGELVDHINGDSLDNRMSNLRICTAAENARNSKPRGGTSQYKGVTLHKCGKWQVQLRGKYLGLFASEADAARAHDKAAAASYGDFAWLNFKESAK